MRKNIKFFPFIFVIAVWFSFSLPFFIGGKVPFPSDFQVNSFSPWSSYPEFAGPVKNNAQPDIITQIYPWRHFTIEQLKLGELPLWNPYSFSGTPHLANYQSVALSPFNILFFLPLSFVDVWSVLVLLQPLLAGVSMLLFARSLGIGRVGSSISAVSFMFCSFIVTWMGYGTLPFAIAFLPLALFAVEKFFKTMKSIYGALLSITIAFSFLSGHFQISLYFLLAVVLYLLFKSLFVEKSGRVRLFIFSLSGVLLAMPQIVPTIEFYTESVRSGIFMKAEIIPWGYLPTFLAPDYFGNPVTRNDWFGHYAEWGGYAGAGVFILALLSVLGKKTKTIWFFIVLLLLSVFLAYNTPLISLLVSLKIPVLSTSAASRIIVLASFSLALLAGFGYDMLPQLFKNKRLLIMWVFVSGLVVVAMMLGAFIGIGDSTNRMTAIKNSVIPLGVAGVVVIGGIVIAFTNKKFIQIVGLFILLLISFEMYRFATKWQAFDPKERVFAVVSSTEFLSKDFGADRVIGNYGAENDVYYSLQNVGGYDPLYPARYGEFVKFVETGKLLPGDRSVVNFPRNGKYSSTAVNLLGARYIVEKNSDYNMAWGFPFSLYPEGTFEKVYDDGKISAFKNFQAFPRANVVSVAIKETDKEKILEGMFGSNLLKTAFVEKDVALAPSASGTAEIVSYTPNRITINALTNGATLLVLSDNFYPGWKASVNGKDAEILRTNYTFRGVVIPEGKSSIEFNYLPQSLIIGTYLALIGLFLMVSTFSYNALRGKK